MVRMAGGWSGRRIYKVICIVPALLECGAERS